MIPGDPGDVWTWTDDGEEPVVPVETQSRVALGVRLGCLFLLLVGL